MERVDEAFGIGLEVRRAKPFGAGRERVARHHRGAQRKRAGAVRAMSAIGTALADPLGATTACSGSGTAKPSAPRREPSRPISPKM